MINVYDGKNMMFPLSFQKKKYDLSIDYISDASTGIAYLKVKKQRLMLTSLLSCQLNEPQKHL